MQGVGQVVALPGARGEKGCGERGLEAKVATQVGLGSCPPPLGDGWWRPGDAASTPPAGNHHLVCSGPRRESGT